MRPIFLLLFLAGMPSTVFSQPYRIIDPARDYYYGDMNRVIHIDSVAVGNSDTLYFNYELVDLCYVYWQFPQWLGQPVRVDTAGVYTFQNDHDEAVTVHTRSRPLDRWALYTYPNGDYIEATHLSTMWENILDVQDSVKRVSLEMKDSLGNALPGDWNGKSFRLSKNHSLDRMFNFDHFPQDTTTYPLRGISHPNVGQVNIRAKDIFNFEVGDEIQFLYFHHDEYLIASNITKWVIIEKEIFPDSFRYEIETARSRLNNGVRTLEIDTVVRVWDISPPADLPFQFQQSPYPHFKKYGVSSQYNGRRIVRTQPLGLDTTMNCWDVEGNGSYAIEGLGNGYFAYGASAGTYVYEPIYFKQGGEVWGTPHEHFMVGIDPAVNAGVRLFPNPFHDLIYLEIAPSAFSSKMHFSLYAVSGRRVLEKEIHSSGHVEIATEALVPGVYFYRLSADDGSFTSGKLVKR